MVVWVWGGGGGLGARGDCFLVGGDFPGFLKWQTTPILRNGQKVSLFFIGPGWGKRHGEGAG